MQISRIRLSDKTSRLRPRHVAPKPGQTYEFELLVELREWIAPALSSPDIVLEAQPPAQPHRRVGVERPIRLAEGAYSSRPEIDLARFFSRLIVFVLVGNSDGHLKNFSLLETPTGLRLSPLYDVVNTALYKDYDQTLALSLAGKKRPIEAITRANHDHKFHQFL